jgi:predicted PurR-regulated permease PerM
MSIFRVLVVLVAVAVAVAVFSSGPVAWGQADGSVAEHQPKQEVQPILAQLTSKSCPELTAADIQKATAEIENSTRKIPESIEQLLDAWLDYSKHYRYLYYTVSIAVIVFGSLATALKDGEAWWGRWKTMAAVLATISAAVNTTLSPQTDFKKFDDAFVVLNTAKNTYVTNPYVTPCDVGKAVAYGESIIHKGE